MKNPRYKITKEEQLQELTERVTPIVNVDVIVIHDGKYLIGRRNPAKYLPVSDRKPSGDMWLFPGGRMKYTETPPETAQRVLKTELPGVKAKLKKLVTVISDKGWDYRAYGITIYYLFNYESGIPRENEQLDKFEWVSREEFLRRKDIYNIEQKIANEIDVAIRSMNMSTDEILVEVDKNDKIIGEIAKRDAHSDAKRFHRAAHIMIFNSKGEVVLQQRSYSKSTGPGKWDMHGGHQVAGQTIEQCSVAELSEELGVVTELQLQRKGLYQAEYQSEYYYLFWGIHDGPYGFDKNEVKQIMTFDCNKLLAGEYDDKYDIFNHVKEYTKELKTIWKKLKSGRS